MDRFTTRLTQMTVAVGLSFALAGLGGQAFAQSDAMKKDGMMKKEEMKKGDTKKGEIKDDKMMEKKQ
jgi:pentapeptide MXKDX repeat protein